MIHTNSEIKSQVTLSLFEKLKSFGFVKKGNSLIREPEKGLYQIIDIGLSPAHSMMANNLGIGFGVATEEWLTILNPWKRPKILTSAHCELRDIYCKIVPVSDDTIWHPISQGIDSIVGKIWNQIVNQFLPFLDKLQSRNNIIAMWRQHGKDIGLPPRHLLSVGILIYLNLDRIEGEKILEKLSLEYKNNDFFTGAINKTLGEKRAF
jgi:hypothetical protein